MSETNVSECVNTDSVVKNRRVGRPPKKVIEGVKKKNKVGRPAGEAAIMNEMKARLIASPKSQKVLDSIVNAALDDDHKNQSAAWKILIDRLLPLSMFEKDKAGGGRPSVNITISGVGGTTTISDDIDDADYEVVEDENNV
jgi:hypothetical protein